MARLVIERFEDFLESYEGSLNEKGGTPADAIAIMSASTSTSDLQQGLAKQLGIEKDKSYTFTVDLLDLMYYLGVNKKFDPKVIGSGTAVKKGSDILTIGDKTINEKGDIYISKKDAPKSVKITASNNGMLCLARMGSAFTETMSKYKISLRSGGMYGGEGASNIHECNDWLVKFTLGGNVKSDASRGYTIYYAYPGSLSPYAEEMSIAIGLAMIEFTKYGNLIARKKDNSSYKFDQNVDAWYTAFVKDTKSIGEALQKTVDLVSKSLTASGTFVNQSPKLNTSSADELVKNASKYYISGESSHLIPGYITPTVQLKSEGIKAFRKVLSDMAESLLPATPEGWGSEADGIMDLYKSSIKSGLESVSDIPHQLWTIQRVNQWGNASGTPGSAGSSINKQGEGKY